MGRKRRPTARVHTQAELDKMHTRQLMYRQRFFHKFWDEDGHFRPERIDHDGDKHRIYEGTAGDAERERSWIKQILDSREHVLNKEESRKARIERKKTGVKRKKSKG